MVNYGDTINQNFEKKGKFNGNMTDFINSVTWSFYLLKKHNKNSIKKCWKEKSSLIS